LLGNINVYVEHLMCLGRRACMLLRLGDTYREMVVRVSEIAKS